jgi:hypothetical protein
MKVLKVRKVLKFLKVLKNSQLMDYMVSLHFIEFYRVLDNGPLYCITLWFGPGHTHCGKTPVFGSRKIQVSKQFLHHLSRGNSIFKACAKQFFNWYRAGCPTGLVHGQRQETLDLPYLTLLCDKLKNRMFHQNFFSWHYFGNLLVFSSYPHHSTISQPNNFIRDCRFIPSSSARNSDVYLYIAISI